MAQFNESDHPRDEDGKFTSGGGGGNSPKTRDEIKQEMSSLRTKLKTVGGSIFSPSKERQEIMNQLNELQTQLDSMPTTTPKVSSTQTTKQEAKKSSNPVTPQKEAQFKIIQKNNAMTDDYHTGIRSASDIQSPQEAFGGSNSDSYSYPDFTKEDGEKALKTGKITVYSSKPINQGGFVSPSKMMAQDYAGLNGKVYSQEVSVDDVAWINSDEGQFASVYQDQKNEFHNWFNS